MCTVSYVPSPEGIIITSNRDENGNRCCAFKPIIKNYDGYQLAYPKDPKSNGSWIGIKNDGTIAVLLNGAFENHVKLPSYRKSRGTILLEILQSSSPKNAFEEIELENIENFTLILSTKKSLAEYRWDGKQKHKKTLNVNQPYIWSSATLYPQQIRNKRAQWFSNWLKSEPNINQEKAIQFHHLAGSGDKENGLIIERDNNIATVSITSIILTTVDVKMLYKDLKNHTSTSVYLKLKNSSKSSFFEKLRIKLKISSIKILNWEYWPMQVVYAPMLIYWFYLSAKARSLFFFSAANPQMINAGFALDKKSESYRHLDQSVYPKTVLFNHNTQAPELKAQLDHHQIYFPIIAKPDMGERGNGVKLIANLADLVDYSRQSKFNFLAQQYIDLENEIGIFYHRLPATENGKITGIVGKQFLKITGDGKSSMELLIRKDNRYLLQIKKLDEIYGDELDQILPKGEEKLLVPYGNHCRGAKFVDLSDKISENLTQVIDHVCKQIPEFYFGRLDIKFKSWDDLTQGKNFFIIELNGAASEPTHMYDPKHSIFFAFKEIKKHWDLLYKISLSNAKIKAIPLMNTVEGIKMISAHAKYLKALANS